MAIVIVDGIKIDTTLWIDPQTARFRDQSEPLNTRRKKLSKEIVRAKAERKDGERKNPRDIHFEAHAKAYLGELERIEKELADEWEQKVKSLNANRD